MLDCSTPPAPRVTGMNNEQCMWAEMPQITNMKCKIGETLLPSLAPIEEAPNLK